MFPTEPQAFSVPQELVLVNMLAVVPDALPLQESVPVGHSLAAKTYVRFNETLNLHRNLMYNVLVVYKSNGLLYFVHVQSNWPRTR